MGVKQPIITVGFDKNGEIDFGVSALLMEMPAHRMKEIRAMIPVAIGVAEDMWKSNPPKDLVVAQQAKQCVRK